MKELKNNVEYLNTQNITTVLNKLLLALACLGDQK